MTQKEIANEIMYEFARTNSRPNHIIQQRWFIQVLSRKLNPKEQKLINPAIQDLINARLATIEDRNGWCLVLTEQGFDEIYPIDETSKTNEIAQKIMTHFTKTNARIGHKIDGKWINSNLRKVLNPKEETLLDAAIQKLVTDNYITIDDRNGWRIVLTQQGFDAIY